eukprot:snap_masked-scaffold_3-processed-gene-21.61-mRNA-1 protein AED:1.00 eAED:1.00 QI:0/0/0/0/1/1/2/0/86
MRKRKQMNSNSVSIAEGKYAVTAWERKLDTVLIQIVSIRCAIRFLSIVVGLTFILLASFPRISPLMQYLLTFLGGCIYPILALRFH